MIELDKELASEHLNSSLREEIEKVLEQYAIRKVPKDETLKECLQAYTKDKLFDLSVENNFDAKKSWKKAKLVEYIEESILDNIEEQFVHLGEHNLMLLQQLVNEEVNVADLDSNEAEDVVFVFSEALSRGFLFTSEEKNNVLILMPEEIQKQLAINLPHIDHLKREFQFRI